MPFTNVLSEEIVAQALTAIQAFWMDRIYSPLVTLWVFLGQVLSADHSCRAAVARLIAHRISHGQRPCSSETGAYCQARKRLPEKFFSEAARQTGRTWRPTWIRSGFGKGAASTCSTDRPCRCQIRRGTNVLTRNPLRRGPAWVFPVARIAAVFSLACGAVLDLAICRYAGKGQSELGMLRKLWGLFRPGDVLLADRLMCSWTEMVMLKQRGVDSVTRLSKRHAGFRRGTRLGKGDHIVRWPKPTKPRTIDRKTYNLLPEFLTVRETLVRVEQTGFRTRTLVVVTTLLDAEITEDDLAQLYRARWNAELDLRSLKQTMQMDILRCKTPELVRKEIWTHLLAYNLIRTIMAQAAITHRIDPRSISFKATIQTLEAFQPVIAMQGRFDSATRRALYRQLLDAIAIHRVADRPDRFEPRRKKRRPKPYERLMKSRRETKRDILNGFSKN